MLADEVALLTRRLTAIQGDTEVSNMKVLGFRSDLACVPGSAANLLCSVGQAIPFSQSLLLSPERLS